MPPSTKTDNQPSSQATGPPPLMDRFGRVHRSLRISVTDVCNIRCQYCMPSETVRFLPRESLLSYAQIVQFVRIATRCGIQRYRITGGEPLTRPELPELLRQLSEIEGLNDLALTTNGMLLADQAQSLVSAGLKRVNISLDTLSEDTFKRLSRRSGIGQVLNGIEAAVACPGLDVKLNALVMRGINLDDVLELVAFARQRDITMRFIEFMPLDADGAWNDALVVSGKELRQIIAAELGPLTPLTSTSAAQPSNDYALSGGGRVGFIDSVSQPFCGGCDRLRLTAEGRLRNCLFGQEEWDISQLLKQTPVDEQEVIDLMRHCVEAKHAAHGIAQPGFTPPARAMYQIGG